MSLGWEINENETLRGKPAVDVLPSDFSDNVSASYKSTFAENSFFWRNNELNSANDKRIEALENHLGKPFNEAIKELPEEEVKEFTKLSAQSGGQDAAYKLQNLFIDRLSKGIRDSGGQINIKTSKEIEASVIDKAKTLGWKAAATQRGSSSFDKYVGGFVGGAAGTLRDPINAASMFLGSGQVKLGAKILQESLIGAGVEALQVTQPEFGEWKRAIGQEWGFSEAMQNILIAGAAAGGFVGAASVITKGARYTASRAFTELEHALKKPNKSFGNLDSAAKANLRDTADYAGLQARKSIIDEYSPFSGRDNVTRHVTAIDEFEGSSRAGRPTLSSLSERQFTDGLRARGGKFDNPSLNVLRDVVTEPPKKKNKKNRKKATKVAENFSPPKRRYFSFEEAANDYSEESVSRRADLILEDLETRAETDPNATMLIDDRVLSVRDVLDEVKEQQSHIEAFRTCGLK